MAHGLRASILQTSMHKWFTRKGEPMAYTQSNRWAKQCCNQKKRAASRGEVAKMVDEAVADFDQTFDHFEQLGTIILATFSGEDNDWMPKRAKACGAVQVTGGRVFFYRGAR